jgi:hypothetical protein
MAYVCSARRSGSRMAGVHLGDHGDHEFRLVEGNPVTAVRRNEMTSARRARGKRVLLPHPVIARIRRRDRHERQVAVPAGRQVEDLGRAGGNRFDLAAQRIVEAGLRPEPAQRSLGGRRQFPHRREQPVLIRIGAQVASRDELHERARRPERAGTDERRDDVRHSEPGRDRSLPAQPGATIDPHLLLRGRSDPVLGMRGIDQHQPGGILAISRCEDAHDEAAERMPDEQVGRGLTGPLEQRPELAGDPSRRARPRAGLAPSEAGAIIGARAREARHGRLHERPADRGPGQRRIEDDDRRTLPHGDQVQAESADVDEAAGRLAEDGQTPVPLIA